MNKIKRAVFLTLCFIMMVSMFAGCSSSEPTSQSTSQATSESETTDVATTADSVSGDVTWWTWSTEATDVFTQQIELAKQSQPNVNVNLEFLANADYWTKLPIAIAGGSGPDMYQMTRPSFELYAVSDQAMDLTDAIANSEILQEYLNALDPVVVETYQWEGKQMAIPFTVESTCIAYNKTMFEEAGLPDLKEIEDTWTWEDLREMANELTVVNNAGETEQYGFLIGAERIPVWELIWSHGAEMFNETQDESTMADQAVIDAVQPLVDMYIEDGVSPSTHGEMSVSGDDLFISGKIGMVCAGIWKMPSYRNITSFEWDVVQLPFDSTTGERVTSSNVLAYVVNPNTKNIDATIAFLEELVKAESQKLFADESIYIPALESVRDSYFAYDVPSNLMAYNEALGNAHPNTLSPYISYAQYNEEFVNALKSAYSGDVELTEAFTTMENNINAVIEENKKLYE